MPIFAASSGIVMPGWPCTKESASAARVPLPLRLPARRLAGRPAGLRAAFALTAFGAFAAFVALAAARRGRPGPAADDGSSGLRGSRPERARQGDRGGLQAVELLHQRLELLQSIGDLSALLVKEVGHGYVLARVREGPAYTRCGPGNHDRCLTARGR